MGHIKGNLAVQNHSGCSDPASPPSLPISSPEGGRHGFVSLLAPLRKAEVLTTLSHLPREWSLAASSAQCLPSASQHPHAFSPPTSPDPGLLCIAWRTTVECEAARGVHMCCHPGGCRPCSPRCPSAGEAGRALYRSHPGCSGRPPPEGQALLLALSLDTPLHLMMVQGWSSGGTSESHSVTRDTQPASRLLGAFSFLFFLLFFPLLFLKPTG